MESLASNPVFDAIGLISADTALREALAERLSALLPGFAIQVWDQWPQQEEPLLACRTLIVDSRTPPPDPPLASTLRAPCPILLLDFDEPVSPLPPSLAGAVVHVPGRDLPELTEELRHSLRALELIRVQNGTDRESPPPYQDFFEHCPDLYFIVDEQFQIRFVNVEGARHLLYAPRELIGEDIRRLVHPEDHPRLGHQVQTLLHDPTRTLHQELRMKTRQGTVLHVSEHINLHAGAGRGPTLLRILCRDITPRLREDRRLDAQREQTHRQQRLESLAILAGAIAHDLNNTLGPVVGYPDLLLPHFHHNSPEHRDLLAIKEAGEHASAIIHDLLDLAAQGRRGISRNFDLNEVVRSLLATPFFRQSSSAHPEVTCRLDLAPSLPPVHGCPQDMAKLVQQLLANAFEAMPDRGELLLHTREAVLDDDQIGFSLIPPGRYTVLRVRDTGCGIDPADHERIFEPFFSRRAPRPHHRAGLGLAIVQGILRDYAGYLELDSAPGHGTTIEVFLPASEIEESSPYRLPPPLDHPHPHILIVDDREDQRDLASRLCQSLHCTVETFASGQAVLQRLTRPPPPDQPPPPRPDLLLLDIVMGEGIGGLEVLTHLRTLHPTLPVILQSGFARTSHTDRALQDPHVRFLCKPYSLHDLRHAIEDLCGKRPDTPEPRPQAPSSSAESARSQSPPPAPPEATESDPGATRASPPGTSPES